ncbi:Nicastrin [Hondaea fermentalgiana]|uniref:Nicastrin n=1 Tax=Hondaea fermentalgiana TaxID=2315210 RepID=A0A2R5GI30_9STRA|nr:Nicastrin [Hondaea fermentalgiana]|eukprot:GBG29979.1 Nicastrin [Hondaea fermentalgiana]
MGAARKVLAAWATLAALALTGLQPARAEVNGVNAMTEAMLTEYASLPCVRSIARDGAVGCGSPSDRSVAEGGALFLVESVEDVTGLIENAQGFDAVALVVDDALLHGDSLRAMQDLARKIRVAAVIVTVEEDGSPQEPPRSSAAPTTWIPSGDGLLNETVSFVVTRLRNATQSEEIRALAASNRDRGYADAVFQHSARYQFYLGKETATSLSCLVSGRCDPLGGLSVWASAGPVPVNSAKETVLLTANLDAASFFHDVVPARDTTASGVAAVLLAAKALASVDESVLEALSKQIVVALFNGEVWSRAGSRRFVHDVALGECLSPQTASPYNESTCANPPVYALAWTSLGLENITDVVSVNNVAGNESDTFYVHSAAGTASANAAAALQSVASSSTDVDVSITSATTSGVVPPSPLDSFLAAELETDVSFGGAGLVVSGFDAAITDANPRYSSRYDRRDEGSEADDAEALTAARIADVATLLARHAFVQAGGSTSDAVNFVLVDETHAAELWDCLTKDFACTLVADVIGAEDTTAVADFMGSTLFAASEGIAGGAPNFFSGIYSPFPVENNVMRPVPLFVRDYLAQYGRNASLVEKATESAKYACAQDLECMAMTEPPECELGRSALACLRGGCVCSNAYFHDAVSPALVYEGGAFSVDAQKLADDDGLWTEPRWSDGTLTLYTSANSASTTIALLVCGILLTIGCVFALRKAQGMLDNTKYKLN